MDYDPPFGENRISVSSLVFEIQTKNSRHLVDRFRALYKNLLTLFLDSALSVILL